MLRQPHSGPGLSSLDEGRGQEDLKYTLLHGDKGNLRTFISFFSRDKCVSAPKETKEADDGVGANANGRSFACVRAAGALRASCGSWRIPSLRRPVGQVCRRLVRRR